MVTDINVTFGELKDAEEEFLITSSFNLPLWPLQKLDWILEDSKFNQRVVPIIASISLLEQNLRFKADLKNALFSIPSRKIEAGLIPMRETTSVVLPQGPVNFTTFCHNVVQ